MTTNSSATGEQPRATGTTGSPMFRRTAAETLYLFGKVFCGQDVGDFKDGHSSHVVSFKSVCARKCD